jgi:hypothetical protein
MPTFRAFILALHIPTSEVLNYGEDFDNMEDAVSQPYWLLDRLHKDLGSAATAGRTREHTSTSFLAPSFR